MLVARMRERAAFEVLKRQPDDAQLEAWLQTHRETYEEPLRYDFEFIAFPKAQSNAQEALEASERALAAGKNPASMGRPVVGGDLTVAEMKDRVEPELVERIPSLSPGGWWRVETKQSLLLARVKHVGGGLPGFETLKPRLMEDWWFAARRDAVERIVERIVERYHFEERP